jgi:hypothetical protein
MRTKGEETAPETEEAKEAGRLLEEFLSLDINAMTPLEALNLLSGWKERIVSPKRPRPPGARSGKRPPPAPDAGSPSLFDN